MFLNTAKVGPLGNGAAVQYTRNGTTTSYYDKELKSAAEFSKQYVGNGGLVGGTHAYKISNRMKHVS